MKTPSLGRAGRRIALWSLSVVYATIQASRPVPAVEAPQSPAWDKVKFGYLNAPAANIGGLRMAEGDGAGKNGASGATGGSPPSSAGSSTLGSSTTDSRTVKGGRFPSQPLNFPPEVNQGPGWTVPQGPYRPLPTRPPASTPENKP